MPRVARGASGRHAHLRRWCRAGHRRRQSRRVASAAPPLHLRRHPGGRHAGDHQGCARSAGAWHTGGHALPPREASISGRRRDRDAGTWRERARIGSGAGACRNIIGIPWTLEGCAGAGIHSARCTRVTRCRRAGLEHGGSTRGVGPTHERDGETARRDELIGGARCPSERCGCGGACGCAPVVRRRRARASGGHVIGLGRSGTSSAGSRRSLDGDAGRRLDGRRGRSKRRRRSRRKSRRKSRRSGRTRVDQGGLRFVPRRSSRPVMPPGTSDGSPVREQPPQRPSAQTPLTRWKLSRLGRILTASRGFAAASHPALASPRLAAPTGSYPGFDPNAARTSERSNPSTVPSPLASEVGE